MSAKDYKNLLENLALQLQRGGGLSILTEVEEAVDENAIEVTAEVTETLVGPETASGGIVEEAESDGIDLFLSRALINFFESETLSSQSGQTYDIFREEFHKEYVEFKSLKQQISIEDYLQGKGISGPQEGSSDSETEAVIESFDSESPENEIVEGISAAPPLEVIEEGITGAVEEVVGEASEAASLDKQEEAGESSQDVLQTGIEDKQTVSEIESGGLSWDDDEEDDDFPSYPDEDEEIEDYIVDEEEGDFPVYPDEEGEEVIEGEETSEGNGYSADIAALWGDDDDEVEDEGDFPVYDEEDIYEDELEGYSESVGIDDEEEGDFPVYDEEDIYEEYEETEEEIDFPVYDEEDIYEEYEETENDDEEGDFPVYDEESLYVDQDPVIEDSDEDVAMPVYPEYDDEEEEESAKPSSSGKSQSSKEKERPKKTREEIEKEIEEAKKKSEEETRKRLKEISEPGIYQGFVKLGKRVTGI